MSPETLDAWETRVTKRRNNMAVLMKGGHQLSEMQLITYANFAAEGVTGDALVRLKASGLPQFRDAVRAAFDLLDADGWTLSGVYPDDGDSVNTTRKKINGVWATATPAP